MLHTACALPSPLRTAAESLAVALPRHPRVADWFAQLNNKMGGDLKKIQTVGKYLVEIWRAVGMNMERVEFLYASGGWVGWWVGGWWWWMPGRPVRRERAAPRWGERWAPLPPAPHTPSPPPPPIM